MQVIEKPSILGVIQAEGVELKQRGRYLWAYCPLHSEKTPSFCMDAERQRYKCFGCGAGGDAIDFIVKLKRLSFPDALRYLGISGDSRKSKSDPLELKKHKLVKKFKRWIQLYRRAICELLRLANRINLAVEKPEDFELPGMSEMYLKKDIYEYHLSILNGNDDEAKFLLYKEVARDN